MIDKDKICIGIGCKRGKLTTRNGRTVIPLIPRTNERLFVMKMKKYGIFDKIIEVYYMDFLTKTTYEHISITKVAEDVFPELKKVTELTYWQVRKLAKIIAKQKNPVEKNYFLER